MSTSNPTKRFLILTGDAGFGHRSAAKSVEKALKEECGENAVTCIVDPVVERPASPILRKSQLDYDDNVLNKQDLYRFSYAISDNRPTCSVLEGALTMLLHRNMLRLIDEFQPDAVLSTHHMYNAPMGSVLLTRHMDIPFFTVVTDLADVHSLWFQSSPDRYFVASQAVKDQAIKVGIPEEKVVISGIPVDPNLAHPAVARDIQREVLGLDPAIPTLLFVGSPRVNGIYECLETLEGCHSPLQVIVAAGGDEILYNQIKERNWKFPIHAENYVPKLSNWMNCADFLVTKAGGLVVSEGLAAGLPILLIDNLPGQEDGNVRYVVENGAGLRIQNENELLTVVDHWLSDGQEDLKNVTENSRALGKPWASIDIARSLWQASLTGIPHPWPTIKPVLRWTRVNEQ